MAGFNVIRLLQPLRRCPVGMNFRPFGDETSVLPSIANVIRLCLNVGHFVGMYLTNLDLALLYGDKEKRILAKI